MRLIEALSLKLARSIQVLVGELARIDRADEVSDETKREAIEKMFERGMDEIKVCTIRNAERLLEMNRNSIHDFSQQLAEIVKPPAGSVEQKKGRKAA